MKDSFIKRLLSMVLAVMMVVGITPVTALAAMELEEVGAENVSDVEENTDDNGQVLAINDETEGNNVTDNLGNDIEMGDKIGTNGYYNVISKKEYVLVPDAAIEYEMVLNNSTGTRRQVIHVIEVDPSNPDISIVPGYNKIDTDVTKEENWSHAQLTEMAKYYEEKLNYNIVGGMNTDLYYDTKAPRILVYNGEDLSVKGKTAPSSSILYVFKDANGIVSCDVKAFNREEFDGYLADGSLLHAVSVSFNMIVKDGVHVKSNGDPAVEERTSAAAARSMVGVKEDGTLVICMNDGRGANNSIGFCDYEEGEAMLALGCKWAANCDGGGSSTFLTKRVGEEAFTMRSVPCDGSQRATAHGIFVASNVGPTGELDVVNVESDYDYFAPNTSYIFVAKAIDTNGYAMNMPEDAAWALSDASFGTIENGKFTSNGTKGEVDVQILSGGKVVGSKTITVADPETFTLSQSSTVIPYSTDEKVRTITLPIVAKINEADVFYDANAVSVSLSNEKAGTLDGYKFTATKDASVANVEISIKYIPKDITIKYIVSFGLGSETMWDFENGNLHGFLGQQDAYDWQKNQGIENPMKSIIDGGNASFDVSSKSFAATEENGGKVHNGSYSLGYELDMRYCNMGSWAYANIYNVSNADGSGVLRDVANGKKAIALGVWVYIPESENSTLALRGDFVAGSSAETAKRTNFDATYNGKKINALKEEDIPDNRWIYAVFDLSAYNYVSINNSMSTDNYSPCFARMYVNPTVAQKITYYFDDFTLDYSTAVDDRNAPVISEATYCTADTNVAFSDSAITSKTMSFNAKIKDFEAANAEGLDYSSAAIYVDGVTLSGVKASGSDLSVDDVTLSNGAHTIVFEISDKLGNTSTLTESFVVEDSSAKSTMVLSGHNDSGEAAEAGSVYYIDLKAEKIEDIASVVATVELQTANNWEFEGISVAPGFEVSYEVNPVENEIVTFTITKTGNCHLTGEQILLSVPARVWSWDEDLVIDSKGNKWTVVQRTADSAEPLVNVAAEACGAITYTDKTEGSFSGDFSCETKLTGKGTNTYTWHVHDEELTVLSKDPTTESDGYENRTYCETCQSVVDWGNILEKLNHNYVLTGDKFVCQDEGCGHIYEPGTGIFTMNGKIYYAIAGNLANNWQQIGEDWYYFSTTNYEAKTGSYRWCGINFVFGEDGKLTTGAWDYGEYGTRYYYGPNCYRALKGSNVWWAEIDGKTYGFGYDGFRYEGEVLLKEGYVMPQVLHYFDEEGVYLGRSHETGKVTINGTDYYLVDGEVKNSGIFYLDGHYYYYESSGKYVTGACYITASGLNGFNDNKPGVYYFDDQGRMLHEVIREDGVYFENGQPYKKGVFQYSDGYYYYIRSYGKITTGAYAITEKDLNGFNGGKTGVYYFDNQGRMLHELIREDGVYFENGQPYKKGVFQYSDGHYYFIRSYGKITTGAYYIVEKELNGFNNGTPGVYYFDNQGRMLHEFIREDGVYFENGQPYKKGLFQYSDGHYYFIRSYGKITAGAYYLTAGNLNGFNDGKAGVYYFDDQGRMLHEIVREDGVYFENGQPYHKGLVEFNGDIYYASSYGKIKKNTTYTVAEKYTNGILPAGTYTFDADGKLVTD